MIAAQQSITARIAYRFLHLALRFWPAESRHWGQALAAEFHEIERPFEALGWALGGLMLFIRASASHFLAWLKLPAGSRLRAASLPLGAEAPILPKRSRLFTAAILFATALLFFPPQSREAISTVRASWNGYRGYASDVRTLQRLAARAEKEKDADTLAFVALTTPLPEQARTLADHAVAIDPNLTWIYSSSLARREHTPPSKDALARLMAADSSNAFPEILAAQVICESRMQTLVAQRPLTPPDTEAALSASPDWVTHMDRAFRASRYDSYFNRRWELTLKAWSHNPNLSVSLIFNSLWAQPLLHSLSIKSYANILVKQAPQASDAGHPGQAESLLREADSFGRRITDGSASDLEKLLGLDVSRRATNELRSFYHQLGRGDESQEAVKQFQLIDDRRDGLMHSFGRIEEPRLRALERSGIRVQLTAILALLLTFIAPLTLIALELRAGNSSARRFWLRRMICLAADWVPATLLVACAALAWFFRPYAEILQSARRVTSASAAWHAMHFEGLYT